MKKITKIALSLLLLMCCGFMAGCAKKIDVSLNFEFTTSIPDGAQKNVKVVILAGQSNATGFAHTSILKDKLPSDKYEEFVNGYDNVYINYNTENGARTSNGFVRTSVEAEQYFGPEIGLAEGLSKSDDTYIILKYSYSGTRLYAHWNKGNNCLYEGLIAFVNASIQFLKDNNYNPEIKAFLWMQGEGDSTKKSSAKKYYDNTKNFVNNLRNDLGDFRFVDAGINNSEEWKEYKTINQAKENFSKTSNNNHYFDTISQGIVSNEEPYGNVDTAHYDSLSMIKLGQLFAHHTLL